MSRARHVAAAVLIAGLAAAGPARAEDVLAIEGATVYVTPTKKLDDATIIVRGGRVAEVGVGVKAPAGARRIDGRGKIVTAGLTDGYSRVGLTEVALVPATIEGAFDGDLHAGYRASDSFDPRALTVPVARTGGVTSVIATPTGSSVAGQSAWMSLAAGDVDQLIVRAPAAMHGGLGGGSGLALERLRELIDDTRFLARRRAAFDDGRSRELGASRRDLEALAQVADRRLPLVIGADQSTDIAALIGLGRELGIRLVVAGGAEAWLQAERLARARIPVLLRPSENLPSSFDRRRIRNDGARRLRDAGVDVIITTGGSATDTRTLRQECGLAVRAGMAWTDALAAVTSTPARVFGATDRGTLERGKVADLVVWSGDPFELSSRAEHVVIGGVEQSLESHQSALLKRYRTLR